MSKTGALHLASGLGGKISKEEVKSAVEQYEKYHDLHGGEAKSRASNYADVANKYYDLVTSFYEYGWGESFHFANRWEGETLRESIKRYEHFLALQLGLTEGMKVLDVGCGIGGPLREIAKFSSALVTGLNNNEYQITRGQELIGSAGLRERCNFVKGDFMDMPFPDDTFDAAYAIEATCHAPDAVGCYREIHRVLRPGQRLAFYEWCMTDRFDPGNPRHADAKAEIELGNGLTDIRTTAQCVQAVKDACFEVICAKDVAEDSPVPWYQPLDPDAAGSWSSMTSTAGFRLSRVGRLLTRTMVKAMERLGVAPEGSVRVSGLMETAGEGLVKGGRTGIFTPMFFVLARKKPVAN
ncbi:cycloartenol-C-24-methyltransferase 1-like isoform X2 [Lolium perenne]|uniref:cycloartenol-C-24-methyltransferase 1-like isoform X2 n=1 Tax=Lolium perenne TaxID=4522 RepID=UPI0021F60D6C|nr:cycloartenol-C-24-methyltransferase 1-like isoform X2 [Lolium perenne]